MTTRDRVRTTTPAQVEPIGTHPSSGVVFVGALLYSTPNEIAAVLALVSDADMSGTALTTVVAAIRRLATAGTPPGPQLVLDELRRVGTLQHFASKVLTDAWTSGAQPMALREYAAAVVADSLRRRIELAGAAMIEIAADGAEADLAPMASRAAAAIEDCARRLELLRGDSP